MDVVKGLGGGAEGVACDVVVHLVVHFKTEGGEKDEDAFVVAVISAAEDAVVDAETEEREAQGGDVVDVADDDVPAAHVDGDDSFAGNCNFAIFGEGDVLIVHSAVGDEGFVGMPEVVSSSAIEDFHLRVGSASSGEDLGRACRYHLRKGGRNVSWTRQEDLCHVVDGRGPEGDYTLGARREDCGLDRDSRSMSMSGGTAIYENRCACPFDGR